MLPSRWKPLKRDRFRMEEPIRVKAARGPLQRTAMQHAWSSHLASTRQRLHRSFRVPTRLPTALTRTMCPTPLTTRSSSHSPARPTHTAVEVRGALVAATSTPPGFRSSGRKHSAATNNDRVGNMCVDFLVRRSTQGAASCVSSRQRSEEPH